MKELLCFSGILILIYTICFIGKIDHSDWMDQQFTDELKGLSILMVVWSHFGLVYGVESIQFLAGAGVSLFLICSGYGLEKSYSKNGLQNYWRKRIVKVAIPYWLLLLLQIIINRPALGIGYIKQFLFINPTNWYLRYIVVCYFLYWIYKKISEHYRLSYRQQWMVIAVLWVMKFATEVIWPVNPTVPFLESRQLFSFVFGIWLAQNKDQLKEKINTIWMYFVQFFLLIIAIGMNIFLHSIDFSQWNVILYDLCSSLTVFPLAMIIMFIGCKWSKVFDNLFLKYMGDISYEMFLLHGVFFGLLSEDIFSILIYFAVIICVSGFYHWVLQKLNNVLFRF